MRYDDILVIKNSKALKDLASKTAVTLSHTFADNIARDAYFVANPTELVENVFIKVGAGYQQYVNSTWESSTAVVADLTGIESELDTLTTDLTQHKLNYTEQVGLINYSLGLYKTINDIADEVFANEYLSSGNTRIIVEEITKPSKLKSATIHVHSTGTVKIKIFNKKFRWYIQFC